MAYQRLGRCSVNLAFSTPTPCLQQVCLLFFSKQLTGLCGPASHDQTKTSRPRPCGFYRRDATAPSVLKQHLATGHVRRCQGEDFCCAEGTVGESQEISAADEPSRAKPDCSCAACPVGEIESTAKEASIAPSDDNPLRQRGGND